MFKIFVVLNLLYMFLHSFLAHSRIKNYFYKNVIKEKYYRIFYVIYAISFLFPIGYVYTIGVKKYYFTSSIYFNFIGIFLIILAVFVFYISFLNYNIREFLGLDRMKSDRKIFYPLKTTGINNIVRHPLYSFTYIFMIGLFLLAPNNFILSASIIIAIYLPIGIYFEEEKLKKKYGDQYVKYMKDVPKLIPRYRILQ